MNSSFSRRAFLEGAATAVGAVLISGCGSGATPELKAKENGQGFILSGTQLPARGEAVTFKFPDGKDGILYCTPIGISGAVSAVCTHLGCTVQWAQGAPKAAFLCPCHQSTFSFDGKPLGGPAKAPLAHYQAVQTGADIELKLL